jgi:hypothetical protein
VWLSGRWQARLLPVKPHKRVLRRRLRRKLGGEGLAAAAGTVVSVTPRTAAVRVLCDMKVKLMQRSEDLDVRQLAYLPSACGMLTVAF